MSISPDTSNAMSNSKGKRVMENELISIIDTEASYPTSEFSFRPDTKYPEYAYEEIAPTKNTVYSAVRDSFRRLCLDEKNYGTRNWNPLGEIIHPGDSVLIKPNLVMDVNGLIDQGTECLYTHASVVAPVIDYVLIALNGTGKIIIGDAPMQECVFETLLKEGGYGKLVDYYKSKRIQIDIVDFRELTSIVKNGVHIQSINPNSSGTIIDLAHYSEFAGISKGVISRTRITNYDPRILKEHHDSVKNEYYISNYVLAADVIINMPKPKSHRKAGATIALKNFVGVNVRKEFLPHHTMGSKEEGGDEYLKKDKVHFLRSKLLDKRNMLEAERHYTLARLYRIAVRLCLLVMQLRGTDKYQEGSWYGNNTISKTISDLNKIVFYADKSGRMQDKPQRRMIIIADMIISGEKEGPVYPTAKPVGIIACGFNPVSFDRAVSTLMGFNPELIPTIKTAEAIFRKFKLASDKPILIVSNKNEYDNRRIEEIDRNDLLNFEPSSGWKGHLEFEK